MLYRIAWPFRERMAIAFVVCLWALLDARGSALAGGAPQPRVIHAIDRYPYLLENEGWSGASVMGNATSLFAGTTYALTGDIEQPGWRVRSQAGLTYFTYRKWIKGLDGPEHAKMAGRKQRTDFLVGYHYQWRRLIIKAFVGISSERRVSDLLDNDFTPIGISYGGKAALDAWLALADGRWLAASTSWASSANAFQASLRTGFGVLDDLDLGLETEVGGDDTYKVGRLGGFATWRLGEVGITVAGGATSGFDLDIGPYGTLNLFLRY
jgi:hypothetical protein